jgi:hypothetical protein
MGPTRISYYLCHEYSFTSLIYIHCVSSLVGFLHRKVIFCLGVVSTHNGDFVASFSYYEVGGNVLPSCVLSKWALIFVAAKAIITLFVTCESDFLKDVD